MNLAVAQRAGERAQGRAYTANPSPALDPDETVRAKRRSDVVLWLRAFLC